MLNLKQVFTVRSVKNDVWHYALWLTLHSWLPKFDWQNFEVAFRQKGKSFHSLDCTSMLMVAFCFWVTSGSFIQLNSSWGCAVHLPKAESDRSQQVTRVFQECKLPLWASQELLVIDFMVQCLVPKARVSFTWSKAVALWKIWCVKVFIAVCFWNFLKQLNKLIESMTVLGVWKWFTPLAGLDWVYIWEKIWKVLASGLSLVQWIIQTAVDNLLCFGHF